MSTCTFFGHSRCYHLDKDNLTDAIEDLIGNEVDTFYVGNHGDFDTMVHSCLRQLSARYPHIQYSVVIAYLPTERREYSDFSDTIFPEGLEVGPSRFAIGRRNRWMIAQSAYCLCYINHTWGGAYQFACMAKRKGLTVINLGANGLP